MVFFLFILMWWKLNSKLCVYMESCVYLCEEKTQWVSHQSDTSALFYLFFLFFFSFFLKLKAKALGSVQICKNTYQIFPYLFS